MQFLLSIGNGISFIMNLFGTSIVVPCIILIISLCMGTGFKKAFQGALYMAVGLTMFNALLGVLLGDISPYVTSMAQTVGISLPYVDVGWQGASVIVYSNQLGYIYLVLGLGVNLLLFGLKLTDTFQPTDIWNYYQFVFWAIIVQFVTGSFWLGIAAAVFMNLIVLLIADIIAPSIQEYYGYEDVTLTSVPQAVAPWAMIMRWVIIKLKIKERNVDPKGLTEKFGFWGEPLTIGLFVGLLVTFLGSLTVLGKASTWTGILGTMLAVSGVMVIYPSVSGLFVKGLIPLSQAMNVKIRSGKSKRKHFNIAMDPAIYFGESGNLTAALILIPIIYFISLVMPGNKILMLADIPAMPFMTVGLIFVFRGNILNTVIGGTIWYSFANVLNSNVCAAFTKAAVAAGVTQKLPAVASAVSKGLGVASWTVGSNPILWVVYKAFSAPGYWKILTIAISIAVYLALYLHFRRHRNAWYKAAGASDEFLAGKQEKAIA
ncbi:MAG: PTS transporter subunit IIC [Clostridia bacterium]|nr:PTS transporter subunit IIC [Clostridia bacterium]